MKEAGLAPCDIIYYDVTFLIPPLDRVPPYAAKQSVSLADTKTCDTSGRLMGTGYLIVARPASRRIRGHRCSANQRSLAVMTRSAGS